MSCFSMNSFLTAILISFFAASIVARADIIDVDLGDGAEGSKSPRSNSEEQVVDLIDPVLRLNRHTFQNTILKDRDSEVPHWIIMFCPGWFEPCQYADPVFRGLADHWQNKLNTALFTQEVRFAAVDCATEKALCNSQGVDTYPFAAHYHHKKQVSRWRGHSYETDAKRFKDWLQKQLSSGARASMTNDQADNVTAEGGRRTVLEVLFISLAVAGSIWFISRDSSSSTANATVTSPATAQQCSLVAACGSAHGASSSSFEADQQTSRVLRYLPKEWGQERPSLEL